jgi:hypothetical protein
MGYTYIPPPLLHGRDDLVNKIELKVTNKETFIRLAPVLEIIRAAIWTGRLSDEKPISIMLIAQQESCKTECLKYYRGTSTLRYVSDLTSKGLLPYKKEIEARKLRHIVLLDLVRIVSHGRTVSDRTLQSLAALMEEGESETSDAGGQDSWENFPRIGCLMALTPQFFNSKRGKWRATGFMTRFVPINFEYSEKTIHDVHISISRGDKIPLPKPIDLPHNDVQIFCAGKYSAIIAKKAQELGEKMETYGFRYQKILRALAKANARIEGRGSVNEKDVARIIMWAEFFTERPVIL